MKKISIFRAVIFFPILLLLIFSVCDVERNNPLDAQGDNFVTPQIIIDTTGVNSANGDTIHSRSATITVTGNRAENKFQAQIDAGELTEWRPSGIFNFSSLSEGPHTVYIHSKYEGGEVIVNDTIEFFVQASGYIPAFISVTDSLISVASGMNISLIATAQGLGPISYSWLKNDTIIKLSQTDTLVFSNIQYRDSGSFQCVASNEWGSCTSRLYKINVSQALNPTYTVTYDGNGSSSGTVPIDLHTYEKGGIVTVKGNGSLVKTGYKFVGWNTAPDGLGITYLTDTDFYIGSENLKLFANWTQNSTYSVVYKGNGSDSDNVPIDVNNYTKGAIVTVKSNIRNLTKYGFTFAGWNTEADGKGIPYAAGVEFNISAENVILYANWTMGSTYKVVYDGNGSTSGNVPIDENFYQKDAAVLVKNVGNLVNTGFTFVGWNTAMDGSGRSYAVGVEFNIGSEHVKLFAKWTQNPTYSVKYNGNGNDLGSIPIDENVYEKKAMVTVLTNLFNLTKTGFTFVGWNTSKDGTGTPYAVGVEFAIDSENVVLYANWTQNSTYSVLYNGNGNDSGNVPIDENVYLKGANVIVKANLRNLSKFGFTFAGWNTAMDGSGTSFAAGVELKIGAESVELFASWTQNTTYTVLYDRNGSTGNVPIDKNFYEAGAPVLVKNAVSLNYPGFTFAGWNTAKDGSGKSYAAGIEFNLGTNNIVLYAHWTQNATFTVFYNANGSITGTIPVDLNSYETGDLATIKGNVGNLYNPGFTFVGWNTVDNGSGTSYAVGDQVKIGSESLILFPKWTQNVTYSVIYDGNNKTSGSVPIDANVYKKADTVKIKGNTGNLLRTDYLFVGWNTAKDGTGTSFATGSKMIIGMLNVTLYAQWIKNQTYKITYNGHNNTFGNAPKDSTLYVQGATAKIVGNTGILLRNGYTFAGWNLDTVGNAKTYNANDTLIVGSSSRVLFAKWSPVFYKMTYNNNSGNANVTGDVPADTNKYTIGDTVIVKGNTGNLRRSGYTFVGWNTVANGTGSSYTLGSTLKIGFANVTLFAIWSKIPDSTPPRLTRFNPSTDSLIVSSSTYSVKIICKDSSGIDTVTWSTGGTSYPAIMTNDSVYTANVSGLTPNVYTAIKFIAIDSSTGANSSTISTYIMYDSTMNDNTPPFMNFKIPSSATSKIVDTFTTVQISCTDANGIASVTCTHGGKTINVTNVDSLYSAVVHGLMAGKTDTVKFVATDKSTAQNKNTLELRITCDPTMNDNTSPVISFQSPADSSSVSVPSVTITAVCTDANKIKSVVCSVGGTTFLATVSTSNIYSVTATGLTMGLNRVILTVTDSSTNANITIDTLYIIYDLPTYNVVYNSNGGGDIVNGTVPIDSHNYRTDSVITIMSTISPLERNGYVFKGWTIAANGSGNILHTGSTLIMGTSDVMLYAKWNPIHKIVYSSNSSEGSVPVDTENYEKDSVVIAAAPGELARSGYTFAGWTVAADGSGPVLAVGSHLIMGTSDVTLHAKWIEVFTVTFDGGPDATLVPASIDVLYPATTIVTLPSPPQKTGFIFEGWWTESEGHGTSFLGNTLVNADVTVYANWVSE